MPTPSIQTLRTDAQQVLNLDSISAVRSVVAATLANANAGTPLNPNLTTQQLWNEFYQIVTQPKSDIESIIANQLMKFLYAPPAPGGVGADGQVIFNDGGVLAGDPQFLWNKTTNLLTVTGSATITGDLTVDTSTLKVDSANNRVGIGTTSPDATLDVTSAGTASTYTVSAVIQDGTYPASGNPTLEFNGFIGGNGYRSGIGSIGGQQLAFYTPSTFGVAPTERYRIASDGIATWSNVGGVAGTAMTLNASGLGVGVSPLAKLHVEGGGAQGRFSVASTTDGRHEYFRNGVIEGIVGWDANVFKMFAFQSGGKLEFYTGGSNLRATIDATGNVGIGVTPSAWASAWRANEVQRAGNALISNAVNSMGLTSNAYLDNVGWKYGATGTANFLAVGNGNGSLAFYQAPSGTAGSAITFTQAMTLDASGNLLVGATSASNQERLNVSSAVSLYVARVFNTASSGGNYGIAIRYSNAAPNNGANEFIACSDSAASRAFIYSNGGIANYQANDSNLSDARTKTDIKPLASYWNKIKALELVTFKYKDQTHDDDNIGLIAQQVESVAPEFVSNEGFGEIPADGVQLKTIYTTDLYHAAIKALQEAMTRIEALESKLA